MTQLQLTYRGTVYPWHCDHMGHMNVMWYTGKFDEASWSLLSQAGLTQSFFTKQKQGMAALQQNITYKRELRAGDVVSIRSGVLDVAEKVVRIFHEMTNEETCEVAAFTVITGVYMDVSIRKSCPIPLKIRDNILEMKMDEDKLFWPEILRSMPAATDVC
jgi:acyl-CoA thioester hydrolase